MAKKKTTNVGTPLGYGFSIEDGSPSAYDNNPDGPSNLPTFDLDGTRYPKGKKSFVNNVALGESSKRPDVLVQTPDGCASSTGRNKGQQGNYCPSDSWAEDKDWSGGNLTGM